MQHVINIQVVDVLAGYDVDLLVPFLVEREQLIELRFLLFREVWKILEYNVGGWQDEVA